jgi:uncharacterized protein YndB with AHSA1/START domain
MPTRANPPADSEVHSLSISRCFPHSAEQVYDAWLDPESVRHWLFATAEGEMQPVKLDARVGGRFCITERRAGEDVEHVGEYLELERPRRIVFTFGVPRFSAAMTVVSIEIKPLDEGCELTLTHSGVLAEWAAQTQQGWGMILDRLGQVVANWKGDENGK